jgi:signal transduction histidine kinase
MPVVGTDDEFDRLSRNLNDMLNQIDRLMTGMREVSDNVAHDLRSPLTRLKSRLELTLFGHGNPEQYRQAIEQAVQETDKILSTFNALLSIAQAEGGAARGEMEAIDMATLCADVAELYEPLAEAKQLALTANLADSAPIKGNRHLLFQAVTNLVDNAIKYSAPGGAVSLSVAIAGDDVEIVVADRGPGIPEADRERVLQRFVRLEQSRTTPGNGLGLSLVTAVITLHDGALVLGDNQPGLMATLRLPLAAAAEHPARAA